MDAECLWDDEGVVYLNNYFSTNVDASLSSEEKSKFAEAVRIFRGFGYHLQVYPTQEGIAHIGINLYNHLKNYCYFSVNLRTQQFSLGALFGYAEAIERFVIAQAL